MKNGEAAIRKCIDKNKRSDGQTPVRYQPDRKQSSLLLVWFLFVCQKSSQRRNDNNRFWLVVQVLVNDWRWGDIVRKQKTPRKYAKRLESGDSKLNSHIATRQQSDTNFPLLSCYFNRICQHFWIDPSAKKQPTGLYWAKPKFFARHLLPLAMLALQKTRAISQESDVLLYLLWQIQKSRCVEEVN